MKIEGRPGEPLSPEDRLLLSMYLAMYAEHVLPARRSMRRTNIAATVLAVPVVLGLVVCAVTRGGWMGLACLVAAAMLALGTQRMWVAARAMEPIYGMLEHWSTLTAYALTAPADDDDE